LLILHFNIYSKDVFRSFEPFRAVLASTDCKKRYYKQKQIFGNKFNIDTKNAEFDADFEKKLKTVHAKKTIKNPFVGEFFAIFSTDSKSASDSAIFDTDNCQALFPILISKLHKMALKN
jgi:hypothetical protein